MFLSKMWTYFGIVLASVVQKTFTYTSPNLNCVDLNPQHSIIMEQLSGTWFAVEIISHQPDDEYYIRTVLTCPIVHLSEDKTLTSTQNPLYRDYNYDTHYGRDYNYNNYNYRSTQGRNYYSTQPYRTSTERHYNRYPNRYDGEYDPMRSSSSWYGSSTTPFPAGYDVNRYRNRYYGRRYQDERKYLRLWWDEDGSSTEYQLSYNMTRPGFWFSSGPTSGEGLGSSVVPQLSNFFGSIQVIKAVGDHLVLTFCNSSPDRILFTVILSKESYLDYSIIQGVHNLLKRKRLRTDNVKKTCDSAGKIDSTILGVLTFFTLMTTIFVK